MIYQALKRHEGNLYELLQSERSQFERATYYMIPNIRILEKVKLGRKYKDQWLPGVGGGRDE